MVRADGLSKIWPQYKTPNSQPLTKSLLTFFSSSSAHRDPVRDPSCKRTRLPLFLNRGFHLTPQQFPRLQSSQNNNPTTVKMGKDVRITTHDPSSLATANSDATCRCRSHRRAHPGISGHPTDSPIGQDSHQRRGHRPRRLWQVDHHWSLDLPVWRYRQAYHREVREGRLVNITITAHAVLPFICTLNHRLAAACAAPSLGRIFTPRSGFSIFSAGAGCAYQRAYLPLAKPWCTTPCPHHRHHHSSYCLQV